ncbi:MAG: exodeoxyribonuclease VII small subunit [Dehalococcoidia bacterium]|nr:MAG: exodeoxyribonuclease VII small subunit [Dehalococcoidia bacterium]
MAKEARQETFEQLYARLEAAVAKLEAGGLPLEEAIELYEQGMTLARQCQERLDKAELKITKLRESFAPIPARSNGAADDQPPEEYEYVGDAEDDPFP